MGAAASTPDTPPADVQKLKAHSEALFETYMKCVDGHNQAENGVTGLRREDCEEEASAYRDSMKELRKLTKR